MDLKPELERATRGDRAALRRVVDHWIPTIRRWAWLYCSDRALAEDAVQESLVRLLRFIDRYDPSRPFGPWLKALVHNACRSEIVGQARRHDREEPPTGAEPAPCVRLDRGLDLARATAQVHAAFRTLSPRQRQIFDLVDLQGLTPKEAAAELELTPGAVRGQLFAARRALRQQIADDVLPLLREA